MDFPATERTQQFYGRGEPAREAVAGKYSSSSFYEESHSSTPGADVLLHLAVSKGSLSFLGWHGGVQQVRQTAPVASNALVMPAGFHSSVGDPGNRRSPLAPELVEGHLKEVGRCDIL